LAFIGIDIGTSFIKAAVLDVERWQLGTVRRIAFPERIEGLPALRCEYNPQSVIGAVQEIIARIADFPAAFEGLVVCTQMSSMVLMNSRGEVRSNCLAWRDQRALERHPSGSGSYYDVLKQRITPLQRHQLGNELPPGSPAAFLFWLAEQSLLEPDLIPTSLADFVLTSLCGSHSGVDLSNALAYGLLDVESSRWHAEVIEGLGLGSLEWPGLRRQGEIVGFIDIRGQRVPCYSPVGDYQCALAGALIDEEELSLNISTGSQVSRLRSTFTSGDYQTRPFFDGRFTNTLSHLPAGRSLDVLLGLITEFAARELGWDSDRLLERAWDYVAHATADAIDGSELAVNLSFFPGPCGDRGTITNIHEKNLSVASVFRASFKSMAENYYQCALRIWPNCNWKALVFSGGLPRKLISLRAAIEDRFQTESRLCPLEEDTLLGLLLLARAFSGRARSVKEAMCEARMLHQATGIN
jgi:sugar (pentulose or hexulose) kinase